MHRANFSDEIWDKKSVNVVVRAFVEAANDVADGKKAREHPDLNRGPLDLQSNALPLSYAPNERHGERVVYSGSVVVTNNSRDSY